jgi:hypothetical protein
MLSIAKVKISQNRRLTRMRLLGIALMFIGLSVSASAAYDGYETYAPEIDFNSGASAVALLSGALLMIRARRPG